MSTEISAYIVTYASSHAAIRAERALKTARAGVDLIPVPREISSACGFCVLVPASGNSDTAFASLDTLTASDRESFWAVFETTLPGLRRKEKRYERIP